MDQSHTPQSATSRPTGIPRPSKLPLARASAGKSFLPKPSSETLQTRSISSLPSAKANSTTVQPFKVPYKSSALVGQSAGLTSRSGGPALKRSILPPNNSGPRRPSTSIDSTHSSASRASQSSSNTSSKTSAVADRGRPAKDGGDAGTRKPRLSLAERTMESISRVPPSPINRRRRSSFFQQQSPMPTSRPASSLANTRNGPDSETIPVPAIRPELLERHLAASTKSTLRGTSTPAKSSLASKVKSSVIRPHGKADETGRSRSPVKTSRPLGNSKTVATRVKTSRPALAGLFNPPNAQGEVAQDDKSPKAMAAAKSSSALREQIRAARAVKRTTPSISTQLTAEGVEQSTGFDLELDPFNQQPKDGSASFRRKIDLARSEGRLNISGLALKAIPEDVIKMYDFEHNKQHSNIAWNETVDLVKFIAADNEIESIPDHVFPDVDALSNSQDDEATPPQFAGIELLDLRGNLLFDVPVGLRRLERLTSLNLSRNRLMNDSLDTITQITCLKELRISDNVLTGELSPALANLTHLEVLEVQNNKLCNIPLEISTLTQLRSLNVSSNQLTSLPLAEMADLPLVHLFASKNQLTGSLFTTDQQMIRLKTLDVSVNSLTTFSTSPVRLPQLQDLNISFNRITELPSMSSWSSLISLHAEDNKVSQIPEGFTDISTLRIVDFTGNDFSRLDARIGLMDKLDIFRVAANPIRERKFLTMDTAGLKRDLKARLGLDEPGQEVD